MDTYAAYAIDDSIEPTPEIEENTDDQAAEPDEEAPEDENQDEDYVPALVATPKRRRRIGTVGLDASGKLVLVAAEPVDRKDLEAAIADLNRRATLFIKLPPEAGDEPFSLVKLPVTRGEPRFFEALQDNLRRWHTMELEAEKT